MSTSEEVLVRVEGISKKFCKDLRTSLKYGVYDLSSELFGKRRRMDLRPKEFWAVRDVDFELRRGECLGLIGHNGAGKTTLLRMINGLIKPDAGRIELRGRVGALIALGAGFNPILTGRENIYTNAAILGVGRQRVDEKFDEIVAFAELAEFIDTPTQYYSSGMNVRLGFSVAALLIEPDVLILDEVLAVGDLAFRTKCVNLMREKLPTCAVIFVSHNMPLVSSFCTRALLLDHGRIASDPQEEMSLTLRRYMELTPVKPGVGGSGSATNRLDLLHDAPGAGNAITVRHGDDLELDALLVLDRPAHVSLVVKAEGTVPLMRIDVRREEAMGEPFPAGEHRLRIAFGRIDMAPSRYSIDVRILCAGDRTILSRSQHQAFLDVEHVAHARQHILRTAPARTIVKTT